MASGAHRGSSSRGSSRNQGLSIYQLYSHLHEALHQYTNLSLSNTDRANAIEAALCKITRHRDGRFPSNNFLLLAAFNSSNPTSPFFYFVENPKGQFDSPSGTHLSHSIAIAAHMESNGDVVILTPGAWKRNTAGKQVNQREIYYDGQTEVQNAIALRVNPEVRAVTAGAALRYAGVPVASMNPYGLQGGAGGLSANFHGGDAAIVNGCSN